MSPRSTPPRYRRVAALCCLVALAGCTGAFAPETDARPPALDEIRVENHDTTAREGSVLVVENGTVVRWDEFDLAPRTAGEELDAETLDSSALNGTRGEYVVYVRAGNATRKADLSGGRVGSLATDCTERGGRVRLEFTVTENETVSRGFGCEEPSVTSSFAAASAAAR